LQRLSYSVDNLDDIVSFEPEQNSSSDGDLIQIAIKRERSWVAEVQALQWSEVRTRPRQAGVFDSPREEIAFLAAAENLSGTQFLLRRKSMGNAATVERGHSCPQVLRKKESGVTDESPFSSEIRHKSPTASILADKESPVHTLIYTIIHTIISDQKSAEQPHHQRETLLYLQKHISKKSKFTH
jgi:hypothetical protein